MPLNPDRRNAAIALIRELGDLAVCQAAEQQTDPVAAKRTQAERDELAEKLVDVLVACAAEAARG